MTKIGETTIGEVALRYKAAKRYEKAWKKHKKSNWEIYDKWLNPHRLYKIWAKKFKIFNYVVEFSIKKRRPVQLKSFGNVKIGKIGKYYSIRVKR